MWRAAGAWGPGLARLLREAAAPPSTGLAQGDGRVLLGPRVPPSQVGEAGGRGWGHPRDPSTAPEAGLGQAQGGELAAPPTITPVSTPLGLEEGETTGRGRERTAAQDSEALEPCLFPSTGTCVATGDKTISSCGVGDPYPQPGHQHEGPAAELQRAEQRGTGRTLCGMKSPPRGRTGRGQHLCRDPLDPSEHLAPCRHSRAPKTGPKGSLLGKGKVPLRVGPPPRA